MSKLRFEVDTDKDVTVGDYLRGRCGVSARLLKKLKHREGGLTCNGGFIRSIDPVRKGDIIVLDIGEESKAVPNPALRADIAYEDENIIVFDKPADMPVHQSARHRDDTLANYFAHLYPELTFRSVNRLDKDTSGLCVIAKDAHTANLMQGRCGKVYYACVHGTPEISGTIDAPIARERESIITRCVREDGQRSFTHYRRIASNGRYSLMEIRLETGRTHQIRVHFAHIGHPLAGDDLYGGSLDDIGRQALHCGQITFTHPFTGEEVTVTSELPEDMSALIDAQKTGV